MFGRRFIAVDRRDMPLASKHQAKRITPERLTRILLLPRPKLTDIRCCQKITTIEESASARSTAVHGKNVLYAIKMLILWWRPFLICCSSLLNTSLSCSFGRTLVLTVAIRCHAVWFEVPRWLSNLRFRINPIADRISTVYMRPSAIFSHFLGKLVDAGSWRLFSSLYNH